MNADLSGLEQFAPSAGTVKVLALDPDPVTLRFPVLVDGRYEERWPLAWIRRHVAAGGRLEQGC